LQIVSPRVVGPDAKLMEMKAIRAFAP